jgi:uncharacterized membrane-anchored protein
LGLLQVYAIIALAVAITLNYADSSGLGFAGGAFLIAGLLVLVLAAHYFTQIFQVMLF